jgi:hypothetical protein
MDKAFMTMHASVLRNFKDLYFIQEQTMKIMVSFRNELNELHKKMGDTKDSITQLSKRYYHTWDRTYVLNNI